MGFYEDTKSRSESRRGPGSSCTTGIALDKVDPDIADGIRQAFGDPAIVTEAIAEALAEIGFDIAPTSVGRHRSGKCKCPVS